MSHPKIVSVLAGKIDLDAPVTNYLPWFRTADESASARITVRNLLNQDSGLSVYAGREGFSEDDQSDTALENGIRQLAGVLLNHPAGLLIEGVAAILLGHSLSPSVDPPHSKKECSYKSISSISV
jgi:hypothetical protein